MKFRHAIGSWIVGLAALWSISAAQADPLSGRVVDVSSGDSLTVEDQAGNRHRVRLFAIAAPESRQPFAPESRRALADLLGGKRVVVEKVREDAYGRIIGKILTAPLHCATCPPTRDAALAQIEAGLAWWFRDERREQTLSDQGYYEYAEFDARTRRLGLWRDDSPTSPWEWRKRRGLKADTTAPRPCTDIVLCCASDISPGYRPPPGVGHIAWIPSAAGRRT